MTQQTPNLSFPYLMPDQAQKHVTLNETIRRLDALVQLSVISQAQTTPPDAPANGARYLVPQGARGAWAGQAGKLAIYEDTGWQFIAPHIGWQAWDAEANALIVYSGTGWQNVQAGAPSQSIGEQYVQRLDTAYDFSAPTNIAIPVRTLFLGVTGRVTQRLSGASKWSVGVPADARRFANQLPVAQGTTFSGLADPPSVYWSPTSLTIRGEGGQITSGTVAFALYYLSLPVPSA